MKKYNIVLADPPWQYKLHSNQGKCAENHYPTMTINDIYNLDVQSIASDNSVLFLWVTMPMLKEGLKTIEQWGFTYKTNAFTWVKKNKKADSWFFGLGHYTRSNAELCLIGTKGKGIKRISKSVHSVIDTPIESHSKKPDIAKERIVQLYGNLSRVELFARQRTDGWDAIGNEIDGVDIRNVIGINKLFKNAA